MFVLLTPVRNEKEQIENLVKCIVNSTFKPDFWIIIDDHSTDGSVDEIKSLSNYNPFFIYKYKFLDIKKIMSFLISSIKSKTRLEDFIHKNQEVFEIKNKLLN